MGRFVSRLLPTSTSISMASAAALLGVAVLLVGGCASAGDARTATANEEVVLFVEMETSSDWTDVTIGDGGGIIRGMVTCYAPSCVPDLNPEELSATQPVWEAESGERVFVEAIVRVALPTEGEFPVRIERGHIGETTVRLYRVDGQVAVPLGEVTWAGINEETLENVGAFSLPVAAPAAAELPYRPAELEAAWDRWRQVIFEFSEDWNELYWPDAQYLTLAPEDDFVQSAVAEEYIREHLESGPSPDVDYGLISHSPIIHVPCSPSVEAKLVSLELNDGETFSANTMRFRQEGEKWRISSQTWKIGNELP